MNPIQLEQILPQTQAYELSKPSKSGDTSFADALRLATEKTDDSPDVKNGAVKENEPKKELAQNEEKDFAKEDSVDCAKENQKTAKKEDVKKTDSNVKREEESDEVVTNPQVANLAVLSQRIFNSENSKAEIPEKIEVSDDFVVTDRMISWLSSKSIGEDFDENISDEDFTALIDAAIEFIPGEESEGEKLESAQNLAVSDPRLFLEKAQDVYEKVLPQESHKNLRASLEDKKTDAKEKKSGVKLSVHDMRSPHQNSLDVSVDKAVRKTAEKKELSLSVQKQGDSSVQMTMELMEKANQNITSSSSQLASSADSDFQHMLSNAVQENAPDFVKAGNIVLKDNKSGIINLILKPESLGNVKISLNLNDKVISGQISVQTKEAFQAFRESIDSLKQAFTQSGFETGSFDLNFSSGQQGFAQGENSNQQNAQQNSAYLADKSYGSYVVSSDSSTNGGEPYSSGSDYNVNIVA